MFCRDRTRFAITEVATRITSSLMKSLYAGKRNVEVLYVWWLMIYDWDSLIILRMTSVCHTLHGEYVVMNSPGDYWMSLHFYISESIWNVLVGFKWSCRWSVSFDWPAFITLTNFMSWGCLGLDGFFGDSLMFLLSLWCFCNLILVKRHLNTFIKYQ